MITATNSAIPAPLTVITGGSRGIGFALAECFLGAGHHVLLVARDEETLVLAETALTSRYGERVSILACDIASPESAALIASAAAGQGRFVDVLVNNAGLWSFAPYAELPRAEIERIVDVNMLAGLRLIHAILPGMYERRRGRILNVGSLAGKFPAAGCALYSASKSFMQTMTVALGREAAGTGVVVSLLLPGLVRTDFTQAKSKDARSRSAVLFELVATDPAAVAEAGYLGLMSGQSVIVPGMVTRLVYAAQAMMPARLVSWLFLRVGRWLFGDDAVHGPVQAAPIRRT
ncbi:MAG: SDR family NAD(P)-dependent oxidoreductase [Hyphomicrobiaceae bacterium]